MADEKKTRDELQADLAALKKHMDTLPLPMLEVLPTYWWLSYADEKGFRGAVVVGASGFLGACMMANRLKISPGGEVQGVGPLVLSEEDLKRVTPFMGKLLDKKQVEELETIMEALDAL